MLGIVFQPIPFEEAARKMAITKQIVTYFSVTEGWSMIFCSWPEGEVEKTEGSVRRVWLAAVRFWRRA